MPSSSFDCCDCGVWENSVLESLSYDWVYGFFEQEETPGENWVTKSVWASSAFFPITPNPLNNGFIGCECCTF